MTAISLEGTIQFLLIVSIFSLLLTLSIIDLRYKVVPDALTLPALILAFFVGDPWVSFQNGLLMMGGFTLLRLIASALTKKEAMGEADIIIGGIIGALLGLKLGLIAIYISAVIALMAIGIQKRGEEIPFIPFLTSGLITTWFFKTQILHMMGLLYN